MRESYAQRQIPADGAADIPYPDYRTTIQGILKHEMEGYMGSVTGAAGAGGTLAAVPFEPAVVRVMNDAGGTPAMYDSFFSEAAAVHTVMILAVAANANPPVLADNGDGTWDIELPTQMAPDGETVVVLVQGFRAVGGSE